MVWDEEGFMVVAMVVAATWSLSGFNHPSTAEAMTLLNTLH
jgi:hypothetical protein